MTHHGAGLRELIKDDELVESLKKDYKNADLEDKDRAMLDYAAKLTLETWNMKEEDVVKLREVGFSDDAILDICQVTSYFAFVKQAR